MSEGEVRVPLADRLGALIASGDLNAHEVRYLDNSIKALNEAGGKVMTARQAKPELTMNGANTRKRIQFKVRELLHFAELNHQPVGCFFLHPDDLEQKSIVGACNGSGEFIYNSVMVMITQQPEVGLQVVKRMQDSEFLKEVIVKALRTVPDELTAALNEAIERSKVPDSFQFTENMRVRTLQPPLHSGEEEPPPAYTVLMENASKEGEVMRVLDGQAIVRILQPDGGFLDLCYPTELLIPLTHAVPPEADRDQGDQGAQEAVPRPEGHVPLGTDAGGGTLAVER